MRAHEVKDRKYVSRRRLLIYPQFQLVLLGTNLGIIFAVAVLIWVQMSRALSDLKPTGALSGIPVEYYNKYLEYQTSTFQTSLLISLVVGLVVSALITLYVSHRFAGPIIRLRGYFKSIEKGPRPVPELSFRDGDYLGDLPPIINQALKQLQSESKSGEKKLKIVE